MSSTGQFSSKSPTIRRILKEAAELDASPSADYHAAPLESDMFEWHFTLRGPPAPSPYNEGLYHGRIVLPPAYPLKPPSFRFTTPTGRFEVNREICLSISGHHEETWQPAWGIRTALVAIRSFMDTEAKGQVGGMDASEESRKKFAGQSSAWKCAFCGKTNGDIMKEHDQIVHNTGHDATTAEETVPENLRLAYREDLKEVAQSSVLVAPAQEPETQNNNVRPTTTTTQPQPQPHPQTQTQILPQQAEELPPWIDKTIYGVILALIALIWARYGV